MATRIIGDTTYHEMTETTMEQDAGILREVRAMGIESFEASDGELPEAFLERIVLGLIEGGQAFRILACFLVPEGKTWTREVAAETAEAFRNNTDPADKALLRSLLMPYLASFFVIGLASAATSRKYSGALRGIFGQPRKTGGTSTSGNGRKSSVSWLGVILSVLLRWRVGLFGRRSSPISRP
jgi:hypothetical protein